MERKVNLKKLASILLTLMVTVSMILPSMLMPKEVNAGTDSITLGTLSNPSGGFKADGKSSLTNKTGVFAAKGGKFRNSSGQTLYCIDPMIDAVAGVHQTSNLVGYQGLTQYDVNYMACGVDYLNKNYGANDAEALAQFFVWEYLSGKTTYTATVTATTISPSVYSSGMAGAKNFASSKAGSAKGTGILYTTGHSQPLAQFSVSYAGYVKLKKVTKSNKHLTDLCPEQYTLAGAEYGVYADQGLSQLVGTLKTNANGDSNTLELNQGTYYAKETKAPKGYKLDTKVYSVTVTAGQTETVNVADEPVLDPLRWNLVTKKIEEGADKNLSVEGAEFEAKYYNTLGDITGKTPLKTWTFNADKKGLVKWEDGYLTTNSEKLFRNSNDRTTGLIGTYAINETKAPKGLARDEKTIYVRIVQDGNGTKRIYSEKPTFDNTKAVAEDGTAWEQEEKTQKINIKVQKKDAETGETKPQGYGSFAGAKFNVWMYDPLQLMDVLVGTIITNENGTGELVKLAPGLYTIEEIEAPAGYNKNPEKVKIEARVKEINTAYFDYLATIAEKPITVTVDKTSIDEVGAKMSVKGAVLALYNSKDEKVEEWTSDGTTHVFKGLAKGDYVIKEVKAPKGYLPLEEEYKFTVKEVEEVQKQDVFNEAIPEVNTVAKFDTGAKESLPKEEVTVLDKFEYKKVLKDHPYEIRAKLVEKDDVSNVIAEDNKEFTAKDYKGEETLKFTFNAKELEGKRLVVLTELHRLDRKGNTLVAVHKDINNIDETVVIPEIKTTAKDKKDGGKDLLAGKKETIVDRVSYTNLIIGRKYKVSGKLMNKETGKVILDNGKEVTAEKEFTAETSNGFVNLEFTFNASALAGKTVVVFEDVYKDKIKVATHADITDEEQSIYIPKIGTKLTGKETDEKEFHAFDKIELRDTMKYENLIKGKVYYAKGEIINKKTGKVIQKSEGNFIADETSGEASLDFTINAKDLKGAELVCFEEIYTIDDEGNPDKLVGEHKDITDKGQTVKIVEPKIGTKATANNDKKSVPENKDITLIDRVSYHDLIIGKEYTIKGILMDKSTGKPLMVNGKEVRAEKTFIAKAKNGEETLTFKFSGKGLGGKTVVVFEDVYQDGKLIGTHSDINDEGQSIKIYKLGEITITDKDKFKNWGVMTGDRIETTYYLIAILLAGSFAIYIKKKGKKDSLK